MGLSNWNNVILYPNGKADLYLQRLVKYNKPYSYFKEQIVNMPVNNLKCQRCNGIAKYYKLGADDVGYCVNCYRRAGSPFGYRRIEKK